MARFPSPKIAHDEKWEAVYELEPKDNIFRSFNFHHKSVGNSTKKKKKTTRQDVESSEVEREREKKKGKNGSAQSSCILHDVTDHVSNMRLCLCALGICGKRGEYASLVTRFPSCENVPLQISGNCYSNGNFYNGPACQFCAR